MKKKKISGTTILILVFLIGLMLILYPSLANYVNEMNSSKAIGDYSDTLADLTAEEYERMWAEAKTYNRELAGQKINYNLNTEEDENYRNLLNVENGVMGYIEIPSIDVMLPIYHGADDTVLQHAIGHLPWSSLPVGGTDTHSVLSGHRGLPSAKLFTNLDKLEAGDVFMLRILNEILTYEVDQILIVKPQNTAALQLEQGKDYCTLVTCTPYGINSHRLLVRGHRVKNAENADQVRIISEVIRIEPELVAMVILLPMMCLMVIFFVFRPKK